MTPEQIIAKAIESSGLTPEQVDQLPSSTRFALQDQVWEVKAPSPVQGLVVFSIFEGNQRDPLEDHMRGDVRVFCIPTAPGLPYCRILMSRASPTILRTTYPTADSFAQEIGAEWSELAKALELIEDDDDGDGVECDACGYVSTVEGVDDEDEPIEAEVKFCGNCGKTLAIEPASVTQ